MNDDKVTEGLKKTSEMLGQLEASQDRQLAKAKALRADRDRLFSALKDLLDALQHRGDPDERGRLIHLAHEYGLNIYALSMTEFGSPLP